MKTQLRTTLKFPDSVGQSGPTMELEGILLDYQIGERVNFMIRSSVSWPINIPMPEEKIYTVSDRACDSIIYGEDSGEILRAYMLQYQVRGNK